MADLIIVAPDEVNDGNDSQSEPEEARSDEMPEEQVSEKPKTIRPAENARADFDDFFPDRRIEADPLTEGYRPTMVYSNPPQPPLDPEDPEWLQVTFSGLVEEREVLLEMIKHMKQHAGEALVEAELAAHEVAQEMSVIKALLRRIKVAAGQRFLDHILSLVNGGEGDSSEESEVEMVAPEYESDEEIPLFGPAELPYDEEEMAELMA